MDHDKNTTEKGQFSHRESTGSHSHHSSSENHEGTTVNEHHSHYGGKDNRWSHDEKRRQPGEGHDVVDKDTRNLMIINQKLANPLMGKSKAEVIADVNEWTKENGLEDLAETFRKGALVAQNPAGAVVGSCFSSLY
jgi:hypothetical protein